MSSVDFLPSRETDLLAWLNNFVTYANTNLAAVGLVAADIAGLQSSIGTYANALGSARSTQQQARANVASKAAARGATEKLLRATVRKLQANVNLTDAQRQGLGITVRDSSPTLMRMAASAQSTPLLLVDRSQRQKHLLSARDSATSDSRRWPAHAVGLEIWSKAGEAQPLTSEECQYVGTSRKRTYVIEYPGSMLGKTVWYMTRWVYRDDTRGSWADTIAATVVA